MLGSNCNDVLCGDPNSYNYYYSSLYSINQYHNEVGYYCNVDNICSCSKGYIEDGQGSCQKSMSISYVNIRSRPGMDTAFKNIKYDVTSGAVKKYDNKNT